MSSIPVGGAILFAGFIVLLQAVLIGVNLLFRACGISSEVSA